MSFSIDLWNGFNAIKDKYNSIRRDFRSFSNFLTRYNTYETQHCKNLDSLYNEFKEQSVQKKSDFELARINLIEMINFESQYKKNFIEEVSKIAKKANLFLQDLKSPANKISELTENFDKEIEKINLKKEAFYSKCKEMSSLISQFELEKKLNDKKNEQKLSKELIKLNKTRDEYLIGINEINIKRYKYNSKVEELMDKYEKVHRELITHFLESLNDFKTKKYKLALDISEREKHDFINYFSKIGVDKEITEFIIKNITKEFPIVQIEFSPFKKKDFENFLNSKYHNKLKSKDLKRVMNEIINFFQNNNIFPLNFIQTGISRAIKQQRENFFLNTRFSIFQKNNVNNIEPTGDKNTKEKEINIIKNYELIKNIVNEMVTNNKIPMFNSKYVIEGDISKLINDTKKFENINDKIQEIKSLLDEKNESHLVYIEALIKALSYLRSKGYFEIKEEVYNIFTDIFKVILDQNKDDDYILKNILILAQTFYKIEKEEKIYIQEGIKGNQVLNSAKTWHRCINYSLKFSNKDLKVTSGKEYIDKINKDAYATVITYLCDLKAFTDDEAVYKDVSYFYMKIYNLKEDDIKATVEKSIKSRERRKEEAIKKYEMKNQIKKEENEEIKNNNNEDKNEIKEIKIVKSDNNSNNNKSKKNEIKEEINDNNINKEKNEIIINDNEISNDNPNNTNNNDKKVEEKNDNENSVDKK